jgi:hypothetical protein
MPSIIGEWYVISDEKISGIVSISVHCACEKLK